MYDSSRRLVCHLASSFREADAQILYPRAQQARGCSTSTGWIKKVSRAGSFRYRWIVSIVGIAIMDISLWYKGSYRTEEYPRASYIASTLEPSRYRPHKVCQGDWIERHRVSSLFPHPWRYWVKGHGDCLLLYYSLQLHHLGTCSTTSLEHTLGVLILLFVLQSEHSSMLLGQVRRPYTITRRLCCIEDFSKDEKLVILNKGIAPFFISLNTYYSRFSISLSDPCLYYHLGGPPWR